MVAMAADKEEVIPFFAVDREEFLEYDITRAIVQVSAAKKPVIGILSMLPVLRADSMPFMAPQPGQPDDWLFVKELRKNFDIRKVEENSEAISPEINLLMVIHPKNLPESTVYAIDQFVVKGGRAIVMVDPAAMADNQQAAANPFMGMMNRSSDIPALFKAWGVDYSRRNLPPTSTPPPRSTWARRAGNHPLWLSIRIESFNREAAVSGKLNAMLLVNSGFLNKGSGVSL